jgi:hypothetical protein
VKRIHDSEFMKFDSEVPALHVFFLQKEAPLISLTHVTGMELLAIDPPPRSCCYLIIKT